ncbi:MAG: deoxyhypusine synthase family protein, partial [Candidatus Poribacteria bacterium]|nr:deoxyhypusine synthase family protein [Candidatus Poribacteria bacterium]
LYERGYNRVYDTLEMEANLRDTNDLIGSVLTDWERDRPMSSHELNRAFGERLVANEMMPSILGCAYERDVPVYVPAFTDSELGLDIATFFLNDANAASRADDLDAFFNPIPNFQPYRDLYDFAKRLMSAKRVGIFTIGGGVPRNWGQQISPFVEIMNMRLGTEFSIPRIRYAVRICPEPVHWGGLSGCTYSEGVSWGKFIPPSEGGRFAEVTTDATIAWPLLIRAALERKRRLQG